MENIKRTVLYEEHLNLKAQMAEYGGWKMPMQYVDGVRDEHLATRRHCGLFDICHMGRIYFGGLGALVFLQHVLSNNAEALKVGESQYTIIQTETGGTLDDTYLYRFKKDEYLLVVNASNREKDLEYLKNETRNFENVEITDKSESIAMLSLQGPESETILQKLVTKGSLPKAQRNSLSSVELSGMAAEIARTGYTGEPRCFEIFLKNKDTVKLWNILLNKGAKPIGLGARDTLRLEAGMPLYGHELGHDRNNKEIPVFASKLSRFAVSFSDAKGDYIGKVSLAEQYKVVKKNKIGEYGSDKVLPKTIRSLTLTGKGVAREGYEVFKEGKQIGYITSGTSVPFHISDEVKKEQQQKDKKIGKRSIALALLDSTIATGETVQVQIRNKKSEAIVVERHIRTNASPFVEIIL